MDPVSSSAADSKRAEATGSYPHQPPPPAYETNAAPSVAYSSAGYQPNYNEKSAGYPTSQAGAQPGYPPGQYPQAGPQGIQGGYTPVPQGPPGWQGQQGGYVPGAPTTYVLVQNPPLANPPPDQFCYSIFVTICCCWLIGIFAIARSMECRTAIRTGNRELAEIKSQEARKLSHIALGVGIGIIVLIIVITILRVVLALF